MANARRSGNFLERHHRPAGALLETTAIAGGLPPLDAGDRAESTLASLTNTPQIERLNGDQHLMLLCEIHPKEVQRWFMERYLFYSYEWVMGPKRVRAWAKIESDGGPLCHQALQSRLQLHLKMGNFKTRPPWCEDLGWPLLALH